MFVQWRIVFMFCHYQLHRAMRSFMDLLYFK